ncbi:MAG: TraR/DksA family transcriptional regulator [Planctomycetes bacterium]|nr:TraR/DksA family transcriptional regulator [Planctomycetota bacterium]
MPKKLSPKDLEAFKSVLTRARAAITGDMSQLQEEALGNGHAPSGETNPGDTSDGYYQEFNLELLERDEHTLGEIIEALDRIDNGTFGNCENCQKPILKERLKAVPHARYCIDCQRKIEREGN